MGRPRKSSLESPMAVAPGSGGRGRAPSSLGKQRNDPGLRGDPAGTTYRCTCCGRQYPSQRGNFFTSKSQLFHGWGGYFPICKPCIEKYYAWMSTEVYGGDDMRTLHHMCRLMDLYYSEDTAAAALVESRPGFTPLSSYISRLTVSTGRKTNLSYIDTILEDLDAERAMKDAIRKAAEDQAEQILADAHAEADRVRGDLERKLTLDDIPTEIKRRFGYGFEPEEYQYMQEQYEDWVKCYACDTKIQEELFKNMCLAQLNIVKAQQSNGDVAKATKAFNDLVLMANIAPRQQKDLVGENDTFGTLIQRWEEEEPIPDPDEKWRDADGIKKYISTWFFGHLAKMFKVENDWSAEYEKALEPYTAHPPSYDGDFNITGDGGEAELEADHGGE